MDFLFVVRNWVRAKAAGKLVNKQTVGEGVTGGKSERILPFFFIMNFEIHCPHSLFFFRIVKIKRSPSLAAIL